jgi:15-cis-phytoene synthase
MTPHQYCQTHYAPAGSTLHGALLFEKHERRTALLPVYALDGEIGRLPLRCHDPQVALQTLDWWQAEITSAFEGRATHPVTLALQDTLRAHGLAEEYCQELLDARRQLVLNRHITGQQELALYFHRSGGTLWHMAAEICGFSERSTHRIAVRLGSHLQRLKSLVGIRQDIDQGFLLLPETMLMQHGVSRSDLQQIATGAHVQNMLHELCDELREDIQRDLDVLPSVDRWPLKHLITQAELALTLLDAIADDGYLLLEQSVQLTPLHTIWRSWRINLREKKIMKQAAL